MLTSKGKYALRAAVYLARHHTDEGWALAVDIAVAEDIPKKFLEAILVELRDEKIVTSRRGRNGGYRLAKAPEMIGAGDVIRAIDGPLALTPCTSRTQYAPCHDCVDPALCALRPVLQKARDAIADVLDGHSLATMADVEKVPVPRRAATRRKPPAV